MADDVRGRCGTVRKGEIRAGVGIGEERSESVKSKDRVHVSEWNAIRKC